VCAKVCPAHRQTTQASRLRWDVLSSQAGNISVMCALGSPSTQASTQASRVPKWFFFDSNNNFLKFINDDNNNNNNNNF
jgi:hypothetical protein